MTRIIKLGCPFKNPSKRVISRTFSLNPNNMNYILNYATENNLKPSAALNQLINLLKENKC